MIEPQNDHLLHSIAEARDESAAAESVADTPSDADIFNMNDLSDIPVDIRSKLRTQKLNARGLRIVEMFRLAGRVLTLDEAVVGYYRMYGEELNRRSMYQKLYNMSCDGVIHVVSPGSKAQPGTYQLTAEFGGIK